MGVFKTLYRAYQLVLNIKRQTGGNTVGIHLIRGQALRLKKYLMRLFIGKAMNFVFNGRAVTRAYAFNDACVHRRAIKAATYDFMRTFVGMRYPARYLSRVLCSITQK